MKNGDKIVSMIPAAGYYAKYKNDDETTYNPVAAWVVVEDMQGRQHVDGNDPSGDGWDGGYWERFVGFVYRGGAGTAALPPRLVGRRRQ